MQKFIRASKLNAFPSITFFVFSGKSRRENSRNREAKKIETEKKSYSSIGFSGTLEENYRGELN